MTGIGSGQHAFNNWVATNQDWVTYRLASAKAQGNGLDLQEALDAAHDFLALQN